MSAETTSPEASSAETRPFAADVSQVLSLVVHSLYRNKEVFLRELVSNASDAIDQLAFRALTQPDLLAGGESGYRIDLSPDRAARTLTISDNGIGMDRESLVRNLGTIAHSGTRRLLESLTGDERKDLRLIGQFGVGFYAAFLVADRVTVVSRAAGSDAAWRWESDGKDGFSVAPAERPSRGTDVILHLRADEEDFLRDWTLRDLVRRYSDFVRHPIRLRVEREKDGGKETEFEQVNRGAALWTRPKSEITDEQYEELYRHVSHDWEPPLAWTHFQVEGTQELTGLLYLPRSAGLDVPGRRGRGVRLFVRRVFIMDECEELVPEWLRFVRGVIDSDDLPLNVSREFLQRDRNTAAIRKQLVRHVLKLLEDLAGEGPRPAKEGEEAPAVADRYAHFWERFGRILGEGVVADPEHAERITKLLRFRSSHGEGLTSLSDHVKRMPADQKAIHYVVAESRAAAATSPHAEALRKRGCEVLFLLDPIEEWIVRAIPEFEGRKLVSAASGDAEVPGDEATRAEREQRKGAFAGLVGKMKDALAGQVKDVRVSDRLTESPACLVADAHEVSPRLAKLLRAHDREYEPGPRVLEVNPAHPVIERLNALAADSGAEARVRDLANLLYDHALVAEGSPPSDPARFARQVADLMRASVGG